VTDYDDFDKAGAAEMQECKESGHILEIKLTVFTDRRYVGKEKSQVTPSFLAFVVR
jgi:hypothetical protein